MKPVIIFTHIPRSGGTSMWKAFHTVYGERVKRISGKGRRQTRLQTKQLLRENSHEYDVLGGHVPFGIGESCVERDCSYFTMLRDPTKVLLSRYYKNIMPQTLERRAQNMAGNFEENLKQIQAEHSKGPEAFLQSKANPLIRFLNDRSGSFNVTSEHFEIAKNRINQNYICFGFVERFSESIELIAKYLDWRKVPQVQHCNSGQNSPRTYDPKLLELGRETNSLDYEFYAYTENLFLERLHNLKS